MNVDSIIKLVEAGFTKEDIFKLSAASNPEPKAIPEAVKEEPKAVPEAVKEEPKTESVDDKVSEAIDKALKPFEELYNNMARLANMPSLNDVQPKGIEDIIDNFFKGD